MLPNDKTPHFEIIYVIVKFGMGSKILKEAKKCGVKGGTLFIGKGTISNKLLNLLSITDMRKEIVMMISNRKTTKKALEHLNRVFRIDKPNHGIIFTTSLRSLMGTRSCQIDDDDERGDEEIMYQNIMVVVDKGNAEEVIEAAQKGGSKGGTIINARGSGVHETSKLFSMDIEPEKEVVMILSDENYTDAICEKISEDLKINEPGNGIIFVQDVNRTYGIYE
ncbi:nitrogen regulatory protein P-II family [Gracilibacillus orientalis]|uniref:Nitrogen regulatory protein P-II family n=1 Tax=Gracilibacillus orientalis TaxID=334253 RepID=A0A1I4RA92_9BACI|nr:P-II family nitrogen regulator [Gracilibacillus orientalis]SFM49171.1 nitrogen regulatory protein P-II family [Gracilibacillus orientalis]